MEFVLEPKKERPLVKKFLTSKGAYTLDGARCRATIQPTAESRIITRRVTRAMTASLVQLSLS
jgi:hypothetical protein